MRQQQGARLLALTFSALFRLFFLHVVFRFGRFLGVSWIGEQEAMSGSVLPTRNKAISSSTSGKWKPCYPHRWPHSFPTSDGIYGLPGAIYLTLFFFRFIWKWQEDKIEKHFISKYVLSGDTPSLLWEKKESYEYSKLTNLTNLPMAVQFVYKVCSFFLTMKRRGNLCVQMLPL